MESVPPRAPSDPVVIDTVLHEMPLRHIKEAERAAVRQQVEPEAPAPTPVRRVDDEAVLDATRRLVLTHGIERTTLTDVAREAGLSRMTVYRRWSGLPELIGRMMQREWDTILRLDPAALSAEVKQGAGVRQVLVRTIVDSARTLRESELLGSIIASEPQLLVPYLLHRQGTMHSGAIAGIAEAIRVGQDDGSIISGDPARLATAVVLATQSWVVSMDAAGAGHDRTLLDDELRAMLHAYLAPAGG